MRPATPPAGRRPAFQWPSIRPCLEHAGRSGIGHVPRRPLQRAKRRVSTDGGGGARLMGRRQGRHVEGLDEQAEDLRGADQ